jgi:hypothetical protein
MGFPPYADHFVDAANAKERSKIFEQQMQATSVAMGTLDESQVSGILARALAQLKSGKGENVNQKKSTRDLLHQILLDYIRDINRDITALEKGFEAEFGDAWREEIALRIYDEDEIPKQRPDETIDDYRARLEKELVDKMLNPDGSIKDKYKNDPQLRKYAEWAQKIHNRDIALSLASELKNPSTTHEQAQALIQQLEEVKSTEQNTYAARALDGHEQEKQAVLSVDDVNDDRQTVDVRSEQAASTFLSPLS